MLKENLDVDRTTGIQHIGVSKKTGKPEPEPENRETGKPETGKPGSRFRFRFGKTKNRVPRFRYPVFGTRFLPGYQEPG
jgi:hypothetical protein